MRKRLMRLLGLALTAGLLWSCGGGKEEETEGKKSAKGPTAVEKSRATAEKSKSDAQEAGADKYAPKQWNDGEKYFAEAVKALEEEDVKTAKPRFDKAKSSYAEALKAAALGKKSADEYAAMKKDVATLQRKAKEAGAEKGAAEIFAAAVEKVKTAEEALTQSPATALRTLKDAKRDFQDAIEEAKGAAAETARKEKEKQTAEEEKKLALEEQKKADELEAGNAKAADYGAATDTLREGDRALADGRYDEAQNSYQSAKDQFRQIVQAINDSKAMATGESPAGPSAGPDTDTTLEEPRDATSGGAEKGVEPAPALTGDAAVWAFIEQNKEKLFQGPGELSNGRLTLNYGRGEEFEKDVTVKRTGKGKLDFTRLDNGEPVPMVFEAGGDAAYVLLKPQFVREVKVTMSIVVDIVEAGAAPFITVGLLLDKSGNGYGGKFGAFAGQVNGIIQFKGAPSMIPEANTRPPSVWLKKESRTWTVQMLWPEGQETGTLSVATNNKESSKIEKIKPKAPGVFPAGRVAIAWNKCMFTVKTLKIEGLLDRTWAVEELKRQKVELPADVQEALGGKPAAAPKEAAKPAPEEPAAPATGETKTSTTEKKSGEVEY